VDPQVDHFMIQVNTLTYSYPDQPRPALKDLSFEIPRGQFCSVIGANGAGKSTLCYALNGFIPNFYKGELTGTVTVGDKVIHHCELGELAGLIGFVFQNPFNQITGSRFNVAEEIAFGLENLDVPRVEMQSRIEEAARLTGLEDLLDRSPFELSGGQQQRLALASIFAMRPQVLVLDEPTTQLDPAGTREVFEALQILAGESGLTIVLTGQKLSWIAQYADRIIALDQGRIVADGPAREVLTSPIMEEAGIGYTRYTEAARHCTQAGVCDPEREFPVTLDQSLEYFQWS
jgi:energy-coupling factor transporter ATP-binding protein EcfA2